MKKLLAFMFAVLAVMFMNVPFGGTAAIPLQTNEAKVERTGDLNNYYWDIIVDRFPYPQYELIDDDKVLEAVPEEGLKNYDKPTLQAIADKVDADIVIAMRVDKVASRAIGGRYEPTLECFMQGQFISYNRQTGKFYNKKFIYKEEIEEVLTYRNDWQQEVFSSYVRRGINRTLEEPKAKKKIK